MKNKFKTTLLLILVLLMTACSENEYYGNIPTAYINFYNAAEVLQQDGSYIDQKNNYVFINDSIPNGDFNSFPFNSFPLFGISYTPTDQRQFPIGDSFTGSVAVPENYQYIQYMPLRPDDYRFIFSGPNKVFWQDTRVSLAENSYTELYLTEDKADGVYRIITVSSKQRKGVQDKVQVQVIHLSADTQPLHISRIMADGSVIDTIFEEELEFGKSTGYVPLDIEGADKQLNNIVLQFSPSGSTIDNVLLTATVPAENGASFTVLVRSFQHSVERSFLTDYDDEGKPVYKSRVLNPQLRTDLRRSY